MILQMSEAVKGMVGCVRDGAEIRDRIDGTDGERDDEASERGGGSNKGRRFDQHEVRLPSDLNRID